MPIFFGFIENFGKRYEGNNDALLITCQYCTLVLMPNQKFKFGIDFNIPSPVHGIPHGDRITFFHTRYQKFHCSTLGWLIVCENK